MKMLLIYVVVLILEVTIRDVAAFPDHQDYGTLTLGPDYSPYGPGIGPSYGGGVLGDTLTMQDHKFNPDTKVQFEKFEVPQTIILPNPKPVYYNRPVHVASIKTVPSENSKYFKVILNNGVPVRHVRDWHIKLYKPFPVFVNKLVKVPVPCPVIVPIAQPYPVKIFKDVPVGVKSVVPVKIPCYYPVVKYNRLSVHYPQYYPVKVTVPSPCMKGGLIGAPSVEGLNGAPDVEGLYDARVQEGPNDAPNPVGPFSAPGLGDSLYGSGFGVDVGKLSPGISGSGLGGPIGASTLGGQFGTLEFGGNQNVFGSGNFVGGPGVGGAINPGLQDVFGGVPVIGDRFSGPGPVGDYGHAPCA
ncbi:uncharacterized protein LOC134534678 [Bacillus rossius redtenbacheri]|uniref:uncharacterized protein LOC134534678 n=1 Tax=Bacillus rossius redtenbacheri TaxID=93214 RepID=UPI002FDE0124